MYPFFRVATKIFHARRASKMNFDDTYVSQHICWPWDLDIFAEMNNGITLSIFDMGRIPFGIRTGMTDVLRQKKWGMAVAGVSVRYRRRVRMFHRIEMRTKALGYDQRFIYIQQSMWRNGEATSSILVRAALTDKNGIVAPQKLLDAMNMSDWEPELPEWVKGWIAADNTRVWPPEV